MVQKKLKRTKFKKGNYKPIRDILKLNDYFIHRINMSLGMHILDVPYYSNARFPKSHWVRCRTWDKRSIIN